MVKQVFINLPVKNLELSKEFWIKLGFNFNPQFTNETGASLMLGENIFAMLLVPTFFSTFTTKEIADASATIEVINALRINSKAEVDALVEKVKVAGGTETRETQDYGWMYSRAFQDLDGHLWELVYMDDANVPEKP